MAFHSPLCIGHSRPSSDESRHSPRAGQVNISPAYEYQSSETDLGRLTRTEGNPLQVTHAHQPAMLAIGQQTSSLTVHPDRQFLGHTVATRPDQPSTDEISILLLDGHAVQRP